MVAQLRGMNAALTQFTALLRQQLNGDSLTAANVERLRPVRNDVRQAQAAYLQLAAMGYSPADLADELQTIEDILEYSLNPEFDPRPSVGDNYADPNERGYGNPKVAGPHAGHGTGVAGIIGAERGNGLGEDGIAPAVRIMALRAVPNGDERDKDVANAIRYAADNGAHIINMSFGKSHSPFKQAVDEAVKHATAKGVLLVHAAGNDAANLDQEPNFPSPRYLDGGASASWLEIGASGWKGAATLAAEFTNYGAQQVDLFAPGVDIHTTDEGEAFQRNSGTSFAAPVVSGVAALLMAYYPRLSAAEVKQILLESATPLREQVVARPGGAGQVRFGELSRTGGVVNAFEAVKLAERRASAPGN
jgi:subtilisin family serine protease